MTQDDNNNFVIKLSFDLTVADNLVSTGSWDEQLHQLYRKKQHLLEITPTMTSRHYDNVIV